MRLTSLTSSARCGEHVITSFRHTDIQRQLPRLSSNHISRHLKRLRVHGLFKRIGHRYKYYLTELGRRAVITGLKSLCCRNSHRLRRITLFLADT